MAEINNEPEKGHKIENVAANQPNFTDYVMPMPNPAGKDNLAQATPEVGKTPEALASQPLDKIAAAGDAELSKFRPDAASSAKNIEELSKRVAADPGAKEMWNHMLAECSAHFKNPMTTKMASDAKLA